MRLACGYGCSFLALILFAGAAIAQETSPNRGAVNNDLPSWLTLNSELRFRTESRQGIGFVQEEDDEYLLSRFRLGFSLEPSPLLQIYVQGQDSRVAWRDPNRSITSFKNVFDLRQAYLRLGSEERGWWDLTAGRQELSFGYERLIGVANWSNLGRAFDAVKLGLHRGEDRIDIFSSSVVRANATAFDKRRDGENLHGVYGSLGSLVPGGELEPYFLYRTNPSVVDERGFTGDADTYTAGARLVGETAAGWDYEADFAHQFGSFAEDDVSAWLVTLGSGFTFASARFQPRLHGEFTFASGDGRKGDGKSGTFDSLFLTGHRVYGIADQTGRRNLKHFQAGVEMRPAPKLRLLADQHFYWLASRHDSLYRANGSLNVPAPPGGASDTYVGNEIDVLGVFAVSPNIELGGGVGHLFAGDFLQQNTPGGSHTFSYVYVLLRL